ncbi:MAG TPA: OmpA family protein [Terracidiphilus sp.]|nr:OmpA family protein [Terracidiphilus sp.]HEV2464344.1 OmpA family protein [Acidobacteriaceae bacterium]
MKIITLLALGTCLPLGAFAQTDLQTTNSSGTSLIAEAPSHQHPASQKSVFRATMVSRTVQAVNYVHKGGATKVDFAGTNLMPAANGQATVRSQRGNLRIETEFDNLQKPTTFGNEYLTYVLWAISPEGRPVNLGEVLVGGNHRSKLDVTTNLQAFALIVTAEPYYAVRQPSNVVVLENVVRPDTTGTSEVVNAKYELMERGGYIPTGYQFDPVVLNAKLPLEFFEARNALRIAKSEGAADYATDSYEHAVQLMKSADSKAIERHIAKNDLIATSREAVQTAEDARAIAVKRINSEALATERENSANAQAQSQARAERANAQKEAAESAAAEAQSAAAQAQSAAAQAQSEMAANQTASAGAVAAAKADADQARLAAQQAQQNEQVAESDQAALRARLTEQLNAVLQTRDSARGLIVSMSDVLFDTGRYSLKPEAREKLAKVAGILIAYPGLLIEVGGYTDNVGGDAMNQTLSENRADSVRNYLVQQGVGVGSVSAKGFGNTEPVASNDTSAGRQQNRRVELVVSGDAIGHPANVTTSSMR